MNPQNEPILPVPGIRLGSAAAGIKYADRNDLVVMELAEGSRCAAVFTRNAFCAAPVTVAREHLAATAPRYLLINSGNANAGTGDEGLRAARESCKALAAARACAIDQILPFSTGVIGEPLPVDRIAVAVPDALTALHPDGWEAAARAIMTTDTVPKLASRRFTAGGRECVVTGMAKGSGMIRPDMATMLAYVATDAAVAPALLHSCLKQAVAPSFNSITVDGDTSTNDACVLVATGAAGGPEIIDWESSDYQALTAAVAEVCLALARAIVKDGEGATKLVEVHVEGATDGEEARRVAYTIAHSPLVKTALFASDPNWGRILAAVGRAGIEGLDIRAVELWLDDVCIVRNGGRDPGYAEEAGQRVMGQDELTIRVLLGRGAAATTVLTCDLSYDYVRINAEYRT
ncbi:MAG TPA: bifunctional glutamate N-acetyltransferase/amino-acid acetyltransferase ArgJ [Sedimenticola thiotaurini]|uniref:Arginine biosynthesis bifunctional protein ArgJ n=1 Tax=Sedimenticola thiotaurini TaxID=1543721 RepID=A0A831RLJ9_9GAMM|nr:bifunctional glutamate N-acetyltransferase/amino-acid acetyltransferase ArgJ [Sedimenticola thiotaurini]